MKKGLTLIEIIMAMAIMVIGIIGVVRLLPVGLKASLSSETMSKAAFLAQEKIEEIKLAGLDALIEGSIDLAGQEAGFSWQAVAQEVSLEGVVDAQDIRQLVLSVSWTEKGKPLDQDFVTYIGR